MRIQVEKLERTSSTLRQKNKELRRAATEANARVTELEDAVSRLEQQLAKASAAKEVPIPAPARRKAAARRGTGRGSQKRDPGDAVPPGVAVEEPEPLSESDGEVLDRLNAKSSGEAENETGSAGGRLLSRNGSDRDFTTSERE